MSDCEEQKSALMEIAAKYLEVTSAAICTDIGEDTWLEFSARTELVALGAPLPGNAPLALAASLTNAGAEVQVVFDAARFAALGRDVQELNLGASIEIGALTLEIMHDSDGPLALSAPSAWLNNAPQVAPALMLARRDTATLKLSDVVLAAMQAEGHALAFTLAGAP